MSKSKQQELLDANHNDGIIASGVLNQVIHVETQRPDQPGYKGTPRIQQDFQFCPTLTEQHTAHLTDINYLIQKYKPDELAAYIAARAQQKREIIGHDFSQEPSKQQALDVIYKSKQQFEELPDDVKYSFKNHLEFLKFIDNPQNAEKMVQLGLITKKQIETIQAPVTANDGNTARTRTQDTNEANTPSKPESTEPNKSKK